MKMHLRESRTLKFSGGTCPRTPLGLNALQAFGKYTRLLLLSTHLRKNLLKPLLRVSITVILVVNLNYGLSSSFYVTF